MKNVIKTTDAIFYFRSNTVKKTLTDPGKQFPRETYDHVKSLINNKEYYTQLTNWHSNMSYSMEKLDILCNVEDCLKHKDKYNVPLETYLDIVDVVLSVYADSLEYSRKNLPPHVYLMHTDIRGKNFVVTKDYKIKLLDMDSYDLINEFMHWRVAGFFTEVFFLVNERIRDIKTNV